MYQGRGPAPDVAVGSTPLHCAAFRGDIAIVQAMLQVASDSAKAVTISTWRHTAYANNCLSAALAAVSKLICSGKRSGSVSHDTAAAHSEMCRWFSDAQAGCCDLAFALGSHVPGTIAGGLMIV